MSHTPGKLTVSENQYEPNRFSIGADGKWLMSIQHNGEQLAETQRENVHRLATCWNACEGSSTKQIESAPDLLDAINRIAVMASRSGADIHHDMRMIRMLAIKTALNAKGQTA